MCFHNKNVQSHKHKLFEWDHFSHAHLAHWALYEEKVQVEKLDSNTPFHCLKIFLKYYRVTGPLYLNQPSYNSWFYYLVFALTPPAYICWTKVHPELFLLCCPWKNVLYLLLLGRFGCYWAGRVSMAVGATVVMASAAACVEAQSVTMAAAALAATDATAFATRLLSTSSIEF